MARPSDPIAQNPTSVRLVQDPSSPAPILPLAAPKSVWETAEPTLIRMEDPGSRKSITITRCLEIESTLSAGNRTPRRPKVSIEASAAEAPSVPMIRASKSAVALQKPLPSTPPRLSADERQSNATIARKSTAVSRDATSTEDKPKSNKLPPFRQSKRWEKFYNHQPAGLAAIETEGEGQKTAREKSIEQQRAELRYEVQSETPAPPALAPKLSLSSMHDNQSGVLSGGLCRPLSMPTWHAVKAERGPRRTSLPTKWATRVVSLRRKSGLTHKRSESVRSVSQDHSLRKVYMRRRLRTKRAIADLRRRANFGSKTTVVEDEEKVLNLDGIERRPTKDKRSPSLLAELHDPERARKWSAECEAMLSNPEFDDGFLAPTIQLTLSPNATKKSIDFGISSKQNQDDVSVLLKRSPDRTAGSSVNVGDPISLFAERAPQGKPTEKPLFAPDPPERTSSRVGAGLAQVAYSTKPKCISILNGFNDDGSASPVEVVEGVEATDTDVEPKRINFRQRMASTFSTRSAKGLEHAASNDTLARIESEALKSPALTTMEKVKQSTAFIMPPPRRKGDNPSGVPPQGPLPDLPSKTEELIINSEPHQDSTSTKDKDLSEAFPTLSPNALEMPNGYEPLQSGRSSRKPSKRSQSTTASKGLSIQPVHNNPATAVDALPTATSIYSQASLDSQQSSLLKKPYSRHDLSRLRSDRTQDVKKRYQSERNRERRISEEDESKPEKGAPTVPLPPLPQILHGQPSVDDLEKFPPVPTSRPQSRTSTRRAQSRSGTHGRESSRTSSNRHPARTLRQCQALERSDIKILVDADPSTGRFRAGAMSLEPSIAGSQDGSPTRFPRGSRQGSLREITKIGKVADKKASTRSLKSQGSSRKARIGSKPYRRGSGDSELDSEDEISGLLAPSNGKTSTLSTRRKCPSDIQTNSNRHDNLENIVLRLDRRMRKQEDQFEKIMRQQQEQSQKLAEIFNLHILSQARWSTVDDDALAKRHRDSLQVAGRSGQHGVRPTSDISSASATTYGTYGSITQDSAASGKASLTDPLEYEDPPAVKRPGTAKSNRSIATALHRPPPVAEAIPRGKLPEETSLVSKGEEWELDEEGKRRWSVNNSSTTTDKMDQGLDRSLEALMALE